jgi:hypothetical protein
LRRTRGRATFGGIRPLYGSNQEVICLTATTLFKHNVQESKPDTPMFSRPKTGIEPATCSIFAKVLTSAPATIDHPINHPASQIILHNVWRTRPNLQSHLIPRLQFGSATDGRQNRARPDVYTYFTGRLKDIIWSLQGFTPHQHLKQNNIFTFPPFSPSSQQL